jgi:2',3'-cyclic-nucleotide 2'-phosphodiesterase
MIIANAENSASGIGVSPATANEMLGAGCDVLTSGNHVWAQKEILPVLESETPLIRPLNYPPGVGGRGYLIKNGVAVVNLIGRTFIGNFDDPFRIMDDLLKQLNGKPPIVIIDFHAEATSEKGALGLYLDGRVTAVLGTHTHVGTIDAKILPHGTAFVTDIGMTGPIHSVIGDDKAAVIQRFLTAIPNRLTVADGKVEFNAILVEADPVTGKALRIERIHKEVDV